MKGKNLKPLSVVQSCSDVVETLYEAEDISLGNSPLPRINASTTMRQFISTKKLNDMVQGFTGCINLNKNMVETEHVSENRSKESPKHAYDARGEVSSVKIREDEKS